MTEITFKIMIIGDSNVGKSSLLLNYIDNTYMPSYIATIGLESSVKTINKRGFQIRLQIWDTAGQERYKSLTKACYRGSDGILFVFDMTNEASFDSIKGWIEEAENVVGEEVKKILIGNKCDEVEKKKVDEEEIERFSKGKSMIFIETSAKNNINIEEAFEKLIDLILENKTDDELVSNYGVNDQTIVLNSTIMTNSDHKKKLRRKCCK